MAVIRFDKKNLLIDVLVGIKENYNYGDSIHEIQDKLAEAQDLRKEFQRQLAPLVEKFNAEEDIRVEELKKLIDLENEVICPNYGEREKH